MKQSLKNIFTNLIISILSISCIIIILSLIFYDDIAISRTIPQVEQYFLSEEMKKEIEDTNLSEAEEVIINYYIDKSDLKKYKKENEYREIQGKSHPFSQNSEYYGEMDNTNEGFFKDDGTK